MDSGEFLSPFGYLPLEVVTKILELLQLCEQKNCSLVCHRWNYILGNLCKNVKFALRLGNISLDQFIVSNQTFDSLSIEGLTKRFPRLSHPKNHFPNVNKRIDIYGQNSQATIMNILKYGFEYTKLLHLSYDSLKFVRRYVISGNIQYFKWDHLITLVLCVVVREENKNHFDSASTLLKFAKIPILRGFSFEYIDIDHTNQQIQIKRFFLNMYTFFSNHSQSLKELYFSILCDRSSNAGRQIPEIHNSNPNRSIGSDMNIQICELVFTGEVKNLGFEYLSFPCVIGSKLKSLSIEILSAELFEDNHFDKYRPVFEANVQNLESVTIYANTTVNLSWINEIPSLKSLSLNVKDLILPTKVAHSYPLKLKIGAVWSDVFQFPYEQILVHFGNEIEVLEAFGSPRDYSFDWINSCVALKSLCLNVHIRLLLSNIRVSFPNMIEFNVCFFGDSDSVLNATTAILITPHTIENNWKWIAQNMPNLQILKISACPKLHPTSLVCLKIAFTMEKLTKIYFNFDVRLKGDSDEEPRITEYCENIPGLYFKRIYTKNFDGVPGSYISTKSVIKIDHSIYKI